MFPIVLLLAHFFFKLIRLHSNKATRIRLLALLLTMCLTIELITLVFKNTCFLITTGNNIKKGIFMFKFLQALKASSKMFVVVACLLSLPITAQALTEPTEKDLAAEPAITQQDIDVFVKNTDKYIQSIKDPTQTERVLSDLGLTEARFVVVSTKLSIGYTILLLNELNQPIPEDEFNSLPESLRPSDAEMALMKKNQDDIQQAFMKIGSEVEGDDDGGEDEQ